MQGKDTTISIITYDSKSVREAEAKDAEDCFSYAKDRKKTTWVDIEGLKDMKLLEDLCKKFGAHPLVIEDILQTVQRPKMEDYDEYLFIVARMLFYEEKNGTTTSEQVSMILGRNYIISFQEKTGGIFNKIKERIRKGKGKIRRSGPDFIAYAILDMIVDNYFVILERLGEKIESMEAAVVADPSPRMLQKVRKLKREMLTLRKSVWPLRELLLSLERESTSQRPLIRKETAVYLRDVYDHTIQVIDTTETFRDVASGMVDIYLSSLSNRMNEIMKVLTIIGTIFIPLTFITGVYGMNFRFMPELEHQYGYFAVWAAMLVVAVVMLAYFRKKKWL